MDHSLCSGPIRLEPKEWVLKAIQRRSSALQAMERWEPARMDWEKLAGLVWADGKARLEKRRLGVPSGTEGRKSEGPKVGVDL